MRVWTSLTRKALLIFTAVLTATPYASAQSVSQVLLEAENRILMYDDESAIPIAMQAIARDEGYGAKIMAQANERGSAARDPDLVSAYVFYHMAQTMGVTGLDAAIDRVGSALTVQQRDMALDDLAILFMRGEAVLQSTDRARRIWRTSADQGYPIGQYKAGTLLLQSNPTSREGMTLILNSAEQGHDRALYTKAVLYDSGRLGSLTRQDFQIALTSYLNAARLGNLDAQLAMAFIADMGYSLSTDHSGLEDTGSGFGGPPMREPFLDQPGVRTAAFWNFQAALQWHAPAQAALCEAISRDLETYGADPGSDFIPPRLRSYFTNDDLHFVALYWCLIAKHEVGVRSNGTSASDEYEAKSDFEIYREAATKDTLTFLVEQGLDRVLATSKEKLDAAKSLAIRSIQNPSVFRR